jgi:hypothetical protein
MEIKTQLPTQGYAAANSTCSLQAKQTLQKKTQLPNGEYLDHNEAR